MATKPEGRGGRGRRPGHGTASAVDAHVGSRVRLRRVLLGMSQEKLGQAIRLTFQQVQKYERGANRIGASRLHELSRVLDVPVSFFFDDMPEELASPSGRPFRGLTERAQAAYEESSLTRRETLELVRAYYRIGDPKVRKRLFELTKSLAGPARDS